MAITRREFVKSTGLALSALGLGIQGCDKKVQSSVYKNIPVAMQLYCVRNELKTDMPGTLNALGKMGYEAVEFADYFGRTAQELRKMLDDNGLKCCGTHIYLDDMMGDALQSTIEFNQTLGNRNLIVRWLKDEQRVDKTAFLETTRVFTEIADKLRPHNMRIGYHNHDYIFNRFDGETMWNILADNTPKDVILQYDTGNAALVGVDALETLQRNPGRTVSMHVKPFSKQNDAALLGEDELDWENIFKYAESEGGIEWYIIEYEKEAYPPLEAMKLNLDRFKEMRIS